MGEASPAVPRNLATTPTEDEIAGRLDRLPATRHTWFLVALLSFGGFFEIYDIGLSGPLSLALVSAGIFKAGGGGLFGTSDQAVFIAATFAGLYVGTLAFSAVADRLGRRPVFTISLVWYALMTLIMGLQNTPGSIDAWRFVAAIGVGVQLVAIDCYLAELLPKAIRGRGFALSAAIQFLAAPVVGVLALVLIPHGFYGIAGWRLMTLVPIIGALLIWWVRVGLPESPRWLASQGRGAEADNVLCKMEERAVQYTGRPLSPADVPTRSLSAGPEQANFMELFRAPYGARTYTMVVFHLFQTIGYFGFGNWLPTLLVSKGISLTKSLSYMLATVLILPILPFLFGLFADKVERKWMIVGGSLLGAVFGLLMSGITKNSNFVLYTLIGMMLTAGLSLMSLAYHTYQSELFPTRIRARAVGFVYSISRLSALFSTFLISAVLTRSGSQSVFMLISGAMLIVALTIGVFGPRTKGLSLEMISPA